MGSKQYIQGKHLYLPFFWNDSLAEYRNLGVSRYFSSVLCETLTKSNKGSRLSESLSKPLDRLNDDSPLGSEEASTLFFCPGGCQAAGVPVTIGC